MQLIISVLILFILINCVLKLSFWRIWQAALFGAVCGAFVIATYPYAILQSKTQLADYLQNTTTLQNMAVIITLESVVCFAYCIAVLRGWFGQQERWWVKPLKWYPSLLVFPVLFYLQTELVFSFPGTSFSAISYAFAAAVVVLFPLLCYLSGSCCRKGDAAGDALSGESLRLHHRPADHRQRQCNLSGGR